MKKILFFVLILAASCKMTKHNNDFKGLRWGATMEEVIKAEGREPEVKKENLLVFSAKLQDVPMMLGYRFAGNKLATATYIPQNAGSMPQKINEAYVAISDSLDKIYGASRDSLMDDGTKVRKTWNTPSTEIYMIYYMQSILLEYSSKTYRPMLMNIQEEEPYEPAEEE